MDKFLHSILPVSKHQIEKCKKIIREQKFVAKQFPIHGYELAYWVILEKLSEYVNLELFCFLSEMSPEELDPKLQLESWHRVHVQKFHCLTCGQTPRKMELDFLINEKNKTQIHDYKHKLDYLLKICNEFIEMNQVVSITEKEFRCLNHRSRVNYTAMEQILGKYIQSYNTTRYYWAYCILLKFFAKHAKEEQFCILAHKNYAEYFEETKQKRKMSCYCHSYECDSCTTQKISLFDNLIKEYLEKDEKTHEHLKLREMNIFDKYNALFNIFKQFQTLKEIQLRGKHTQ